MGRRKSNREAGQLHNNQPTKLATLVWPANDVDRRRIHLDFRSSLTITTHTQPHIDPSPPVESTHWSSSIVHSSRTCSRARGMAGQSGGIRQSAALTAAVNRVGTVDVVRLRLVQCMAEKPSPATSLRLSEIV